MSKAPKGDREERTFRDPERWLGPMDSKAAAELAASASDLALLVDAKGVIRDVASKSGAVKELDQWVGRRWAQTVTVESQPKIEELLDGAAGADRWRQVNHPTGAEDLPVRYRTLRLANGGTLAIGRDERAAAQLQQRLLQVQQSLERDYLRLRQAEARYRLLFDLTSEPMLIVDAGTLRIREANAAASRTFGRSADLTGQALVAQIDAQDRDRLLAYLGSAAAGIAGEPLQVTLARKRVPAGVSARLFRQEGATFYLIQLHLNDDSDLPEAKRLQLSLIDQLPDAFVLVDERHSIVTANNSFAELVHEPAPQRLIGQHIGDYLGRPGIDLNLIMAQLAEHQVVRNVSTVVRGLHGGQEEVEVSGVRLTGEHPHFGFTLRVIARRVRTLPPNERDLPRSVEQLTELVGRMPLKDIVRESTDLIERLCIEAALNYTSNNRASAAEILGLSRQSLYSKLSRFGLGRLETDAAE